MDSLSASSGRDGMYMLNICGGSEDEIKRERTELKGKREKAAKENDRVKKITLKPMVRHGKEFRSEGRRKIGTELLQTAMGSAISA